MANSGQATSPPTEPKFPVDLGFLNQPLVADDNLPGRKKALDGISLRSYILGLCFAFGFQLSVYLLSRGNQLWRAPCFLALLALFHFLEFYMTAAYNTGYANISAFLLTQNGRAYNIAHSAAFAECIITSLFFPAWQAKLNSPMIAIIGSFLICIGQSVRSIAMAQAGTNFNHTVQTRKAQGHQLVKHGIYAVLRHPSYFGFFWWSLGTQMLLGNVVCFTAFLLVLWMFFNKRIKKEEDFLVAFFGKDYEVYRRHTFVGIPFVK